MRNSDVMGVPVSKLVTECDLLIIKDETPEILSIVQDIREFARDVYVNYVVRTVRVTDYDPRQKYSCRKALFFIDSDSSALLHSVPVWITSLPNVTSSKWGSYLILNVDKDAHDDDAGFVQYHQQNGLHFKFVTVSNLALTFQWWPLVLRFINPRPAETPQFVNLVYSEMFVSDTGIEDAENAESRIKNSVHNFLETQRQHVKVYWSDTARIFGPDVRLVLINTSDEFKTTALRKCINNQHIDSYVLLDWDVEEAILRDLKNRVFTRTQFMKAIFPIMLKLGLISPRKLLRMPVKPDGPLHVKKARSEFTGSEFKITLQLKWKGFTWEVLREKIADVTLNVERSGPEVECWETVARGLPPNENKMVDWVYSSGPVQYRVTAVNKWGVQSEYVISEVKYV